MRNRFFVGIVVTAIILITVTVFFDFPSSKQTIHEQALSAKYRAEAQALQQKLESAKRERDSLVYVIDSLDSYIQTLVQLDSIKTQELFRIEGKFDDLGDDELSKKMEEVYRKSTQQ